MKVLEKILQDIDNIKAGYNSGYDCIHKCTLYDRSVGTCIGNCEEYVKQQIKEIIINHLSDIDTESEWIPCDPENIPDREVLCCDKYGEELIGYLSGTEEDGYECESDGCIMFDVVAWMEMPHPYKKDSD